MFKKLEDYSEHTKAKYASQIGARIRQARMELGWSQTKLAKHMHVRVATISDLENGKTLPSILTLMDLAVMLRKDAAFFIPMRWEPRGDDITVTQAKTINLVRSIHDPHRQRLVEKLIQVLVDEEESEHRMSDYQEGLAEAGQDMSGDEEQGADAMLRTVLDQIEEEQLNRMSDEARRAYHALMAAIADEDPPTGPVHLDDL